MDVKNIDDLISELKDNFEVIKWTTRNVYDIDTHSTGLRIRTCVQSISIYDYMGNDVRRIMGSYHNGDNLDYLLIKVTDLNKFNDIIEPYRFIEGVRIPGCLKWWYDDKEVRLILHGFKVSKKASWDKFVVKRDHDSLNDFVNGINLIYKSVNKIE